MSESLEKLRQFISSSSLSLTDQIDLLIFLPILPEESLTKLYNYFREKPKLLKEFNENFKARLKALADGKDAWDKLIDQEEAVLKEAEEIEDHSFQSNN